MQDSVLICLKIGGWAFLFSIISLLIHFFLPKSSAEKKLLSELKNKEISNQESIILIKEISIQKKAKLEHWEYVSNYSSLIHAIIAVYWGFYVLSIRGECFSSFNVSIENELIIFSFGYFLSDTILGITQ